MSDIPQGILVDKLGQPIPDKAVRDKAEEALRNYMVVHKQKFQDWFNLHGAFTRPPIVFDTQNGEWIWLEE